LRPIPRSLFPDPGAKEKARQAARLAGFVRERLLLALLGGLFLLRRGGGLFLVAGGAFLLLAFRAFGRRFALGGLGTVRGYSYKQFPGEQMVVATGEWMTATRGRWPSVVAFVDGGRAWTSGVDGAGWKSSAGVGLDFRPLRRGYARIDVAFPFQKSPGQDWARVYGMVQLPF